MVAAAIADTEGRFLLQQRPIDKHHGGLWEFPGGKVEAGENPRFALVRELNEELTILVKETALVPIAFAESPPDNPSPGIVMQLYKVVEFQGIPVAEAGAGLGWFALAEAAGLPMPPLDVALVDLLAERAQ
ncbi:(deoxy)nucleoside triphosphate pyrophosphohydrolase [Tsuneonella dongtanensis]|uniref:(deoxy)nucleoside triphosphate pyrophosphohydrolase n=1 Tax=Tsuneonella dongtanensis TaxID=692370 RepID=UPI001E4614A9|nr:(deoxy)nucleoside triphosphate pyrophosphohydrolase [Tsuneonella dongtanensis]